MGGFKDIATNRKLAREAQGAPAATPATGEPTASWPPESRANLPSIADAQLPANYQAAKLALLECSRVDECQNWADKMAAMASYARQSEDAEMAKMCRRIQARALERCGELLKQIPAASGGHEVVTPSGGAPTGGGPVGRMQAARDAGLSRDQAVTALRVANVPKDEFERQVESDNPPTITALAEQGKKPVVDERSPEQLREMTEGNLARLREAHPDLAAKVDAQELNMPEAWAISRDRKEAAREHRRSVYIGLRDLTSSLAGIAHSPSMSDIVDWLEFEEYEAEFHGWFKSRAELVQGLRAIRHAVPAIEDLIAKLEAKGIKPAGPQPPGPPAPRRHWILAPIAEPAPEPIAATAEPIDPQKVEADHSNDFDGSDGGPLPGENRLYQLWQGLKINTQKRCISWVEDNCPTPYALLDDPHPIRESAAPFRAMAKDCTKAEKDRFLELAQATQ
jgi:hypothetical protein